MHLVLWLQTRTLAPEHWLAWDGSLPRLRGALEKNPQFLPAVPLFLERSLGRARMAETGPKTPSAQEPPAKTRLFSQPSPGPRSNPSFRMSNFPKSANFLK